VNARTRILVALCAAALAATLLMWDSAAAGADYSDHGEPQTSTVASTHRQTYTPSGGLARTGTQLDTWALVGGVLFVAGWAALLLASRKRTGVRT
jgi:LPXTG-motif cell wall-anchored protein